MVRRSTPQRVVDDRAFPVRVKVSAPRGGFGFTFNEMVYWLQETLPRGDFAQHSSGDRRDTTSFYFRNLPDAQRFLDRFPILELADGTLHGYNSPALPFGRKD